MTSERFPATPARQRGVTLIISLIFLAILMLLGVTVAQTSMMEERMAGNTRDRDLAFQAAEAALEDAGAVLASLRDPSTGEITTAFDGSTPGYIAYDPASEGDAEYWSGYGWTSASQETAFTLDEGDGYKVAEQPRYVIEKLPDAASTQRFRVTARGVGSSANTVVILQAGYEND
ncbi:MAG: PilX N-terminal domain-containing pilus assembly protein [Pseudomonadota bacterium]